MKILLSSQIREADSYTIKNKPIESIDLMESASKAFVDKFLDLFNTDRKVHIFAGTGNNGGDGLAIARLLLQKGFDVSISIIRVSEKESKDFSVNLERLKKVKSVQEIHQMNDFPELQPADIVIDAIFGSGLSRPVEGLFADVISKLNQINPLVVAVDIASGLFSDKNTEGDIIMQVAHTISFQVPKLAFLMRQNHSFVGNWHIVDIGLDKQFIDQTEANYHYLDMSAAVELLPHREKYSHKGNFGRVLMVLGGYGKMGAAVLTSRACLKSGAGLLTVHVPECGYQIIQIAVPEAMALVDPSVDFFSDTPDINGFEVIGIGPGLGTNDKTISAFEDLLNKVDFPVVIDADGLNILSKKPQLLEKLPAGSVLTPHPKEFERIAGSYKNDFDRLNLQIDFAKKYNVIVVVKGAHTSVAGPDGQVCFNSTGNPGMATAGSGDVLTGIITSLLGQTKDPFNAAILGVFLHGMAGDIAAGDQGDESLIASDIIDHLSSAYKRLHLYQP